MKKWVKPVQEWAVTREMVIMEAYCGKQTFIRRTETYD